MRVFVTGATGFVGSAVVKELIGAGHEVLGLARSDDGAKALAAAGAKVHRGSLEDLESLKRGAAEAEGVIHCAFIHDFANYAASAAADEAAIETMGSVLVGRPFVVTTGVLSLASGRTATEDDAPSPKLPRRSETAALALVPRGVRAMAMRLSPSVHGDGDHGFVPMLIDAARREKAAIYVDDGHHRWPAVHRLDTARLYRLALEKGVAGGKYHGVAEEGVPVKAIAEVIAKRLGVPAVSRSAAQAAEALGFIGQVLGMDSPTSSRLTQERLGWQPTGVSLLRDLEEGTYFG